MEQVEEISDAQREAQDHRQNSQPKIGKRYVSFCFTA